MFSCLYRTLNAIETTFVSETGGLRNGEKFLPDAGHVAIVSSERRNRCRFDLRLRAHLVKTADRGPLE